MPRIWLEEPDGTVIDAGETTLVAEHIQYRGHRYTLVATCVHARWPLGIYKRDPE